MQRDFYGVAGSWSLVPGNCLEVLRELPDNSVDAVVTDPPYGLEFMGREWGSFKPASSRGAGGQFANGSVGGYDGKPMPRHGKRWTQRRCTICGHVDGGASPCRCAQPSWTLTTEPGTPRFARTFQDWCFLWTCESFRVLKPGGYMLAFGGSRTWHRLAAAVEDAGFEVRDSIAWLYAQGFPKSLDVSKAIDKQRDDAAQRWQGWGTALKPAFEPIIVGRKPLIGTVAANVLEHGTGALNIDACRKADAGRWPTNVVLDKSQASELDKQTSDSGGASRFFPVFRYQAKAPAKERPKDADGKGHPTVKPLELMRWLVRLVTPTGGIVLDPFTGSGTTIQAAIQEGFRAFGIEREPDYLPLILARMGFQDGEDAA